MTILVRNTEYRIQKWYMYKTIQARVNTVAIPTTGKSCSLYWELLHPILGISLASIGKLPFIGKLSIEA